MQFSPVGRSLFFALGLICLFFAQAHTSQISMKAMGMTSLFLKDTYPKAFWIPKKDLLHLFWLKGLLRKNLFHFIATILCIHLYAQIVRRHRAYLI